MVQHQPHTGRTPEDPGFSLVEVLVVMLIVGVLVAIAIPVYLHQQAKANDASTKADVSHLAAEVATYFVDGRGTPTLDFASVPGKVVLTDGATYSVDVNLTNGTARPASGAFANLGNETNWCVSLTDPDGSVKDFKYTARTGLGTGTC